MRWRLQCLVACALLVTLPASIKADPVNPDISGYCDSVCDPLSLPPEAPKQGLDIGSFLGKIAVGMVDAIVDLATESPEGAIAKKAAALAKVGFGAILPAIDPAIASQQVDPMDSLRRGLDQDMVKLQSYLACKIDSVVGKATDTIVNKMDSSQAQAFDTNIDGILDWLTENSCNWNCLNYTNIPPSKRNCMAGNDCITGTPDASCANKPWQGPGVYNCRANSKDGMCEQGTCWVETFPLSYVIQQIQDTLNIVFLSNSEIANLKGGNSVSLDQVTDVTALVALGKGAMLKLTLLQQLIMLGAGGNGELGRYAGIMADELQSRFDVFSNQTLRNIILKFSTAKVLTKGIFDINGVSIKNLYGNASDVEGALEAAGYDPTSNVVPGYLSFDINVYGNKYTGPFEALYPDNFDIPGKTCYLGVQPGCLACWQQTTSWPQIPPDARQPGACKTCPGLEFVYYSEYELRGSCTGPPGVPNAKLTCPRRSAPSCGTAGEPDQPANCLQAWNWQGYADGIGCRDQAASDWYVSCIPYFYKQTEQVVEDLMQSMLADLAPAIDPLRETIAALRNISAGMPASADNFYNRIYYPYTAKCPIITSYCTDPGSKPVVPNPTPINASLITARPPICSSPPLKAACPGTACDNRLGCKRCSRAKPLLVPDADLWHWTCAGCARLACPKGACSSAGCSKCPKGWFLAHAGSSRATTYRLAPGTPSRPRSYNTCLKCSAPAPAGFGAPCLKCNSRRCTLCKAGYATGGPGGSCRRRTPPRGRHWGWDLGRG